MATTLNKNSKKTGQASAQTPLHGDGILETLNDYLPPAPLIEGDNPADYEAFQALCLAAIRPKDAIEHIWLRDFIDYSWEILRFRRMRAALIGSSRKEAVERLLKEHLPDGIFARDAAINLAQGWSASSEDHVSEVEELFKEHGLGPENIIAEAISIKIEDLERIEKLIAAYDHRRDKAIRELEKRRDALATRAREFTDAVFADVDVVEMIEAE